MIISRLTKLVLLAVLLLALVAFNGCSDDVKSFTPPPPAPLQSGTADILMDNFVVCYTDMLFSDFENILHDDFKMIFLADTIMEWDLPSGTILDKAQMLAIHNNIFSGTPGSTSDGNQILPLESIEIDLFDRMTPWSVPEVEDPDFPGMLTALYDVKMYFHDTSGTHAFLVRQDMAFFTQQDGDYWYLTGIRPYPVWGNKAVETATYDNTIFMYREVTDKPRD